MQTLAQHNFHIPVMGLAFTIDTPVKVARYGIDSVISIIEDNLIEAMRKHYYKQANRTFFPITPQEPDYRAKRISDYLNLVHDLVNEQMQTLRSAVFTTGSEISKYFEMLPGSNPLRGIYEHMTESVDKREKETLEKYLRSQIQPGRIDVNIMTKVDRNHYAKDGSVLADSSDALAALRGYANSVLENSSVIFSAGLNPRLFNYLERLDAFHARGHGVFGKEVVIKVSDYRSALVQGKYLAKKGIWVSEFRIESGLNCGGHAFATDGTLLGPILEEFKTKRAELVESLHTLYQPAAVAKGIPTFDAPHPLRITAQGGVGTCEETTFLATHYDLASIGWGTPFLLCPEATTVDAETLQLLGAAREEDVILSHASPLGVRFNYLKGTSGQRERLLRVTQGRPGSPCTEKHLVSNTEFTTEPICTASHAYQKKKIDQLRSLGLPPEQYIKRYHDIVNKECLCIGLSNAAIHAYGLPPFKKLESVTICPGPNIAYFDQVATLAEMADHIYGRGDLIRAKNRPHMFIKELLLNIKYLEGQMPALTEMDAKAAKDLLHFSLNLLKGIAYYRELSSRITRDDAVFNEQLTDCEGEIGKLVKKLEVVCESV
ncbi:hypothetical protein [Parachryseolinea silvisoli]|uniref:hypothetical protein n=1 Tax=Parachryseolinea silvisoli TaxID=2873601 RepID=UPI00226587D3|nr:hypothetical protein [Parachryseolinea silvisoli]MCD9018785.1 hypothetical protein [Parachryseolinea silvisoli]